MRSNDIEKKKSLLKLTKKQRSIIVGTLLGDGHMETQNKGRTYRLKIEHTVRQTFYVDWLYQQLKEWTLSAPVDHMKSIGGDKYENYGFQTMSVGQFRFYAKGFYDAKGCKRVPRHIRRWLTPLALAVWFMDDGSLKSQTHRAVILNTQGFNHDDLIKLKEALELRYGIQAVFRKQREGLQLLIVGDDAERFYQTIQRFVLPDFKYKFGKLVNNLPKEYRRRSKVG